MHLTEPKCECRCHGGGFLPCSIEGGCGSVGCDIVCADDHRCVQGRYCALKEPQLDPDGKFVRQWLPARITTPRGLCEGCARKVRRGIEFLPEDALLLTQEMAMQRSGNSDIVVSFSAELRVPLQLSIEALRADIDRELSIWVEPVAEKLGVEWDTAAMERVPVMARIVRAAGLLSESVDILLALPEMDLPTWTDGQAGFATRDGLSGALTLLDLHRRAYAATGRRRLVYRLHTPCPKCDHMTLVRQNGKDEVDCENCGIALPEGQYDHFTKLAVDQQQASA